MKKNYYYFLIIAFVCILNKSYSQTLNDSCQVALPFCTGMTFNYPAGVNSGTAQAGPDYTCLYSQPNPVWYYLLIDQPGAIDIHIQSYPGNYDVDFVCWGPFTSTANCGNLTALNTIDCSYSSSYQEDCNIPSAQTGEYYFFMITNYSNQPTNIVFNQTNVGQIGAGSSNCGSVANFSGNFYLDSNGNSIHDLPEPGIPNAMVRIPSCGFYFMSDNIGNYNSYVCSAPDTIWPYYYNLYTNVTPPFYIISNTASNFDFAVTLIPNIYDVTTTLTNFTPARPGFDFETMLTVSNVGTELNCGTLTLTFDSIFNYISSTLPADIITSNTLTWNNICMTFFQTINFDLLFGLDSTTALGLPYVFSANFVSVENDITIFNNSDTISGIVVGSFDPNDKHVTPSGEITNSAAAAEQELEFTIRFQNTGTFPATTVRIVDTLSNWLQIPTLTLLSYSHPCTYNITENGIVEFTFNNINLPDATADETGSHGFVKFKINCRPELQNGGNVYNTGNIYFDFNQPIVTNTTLTYTKIVATNIPSIKKPVTKLISIEPNPAVENITVNFDYSGKEALTIEILDFQGRIVLKQLVQNNQKNINLNVSNLSVGTYMIHVFGKNYSVNEKLIIK